MDIPIMWIAIIVGIIGILLGVVYWGETKTKGKRVRNAFLFLGIIGIVITGLSFMEVIPKTYGTSSIQTPVTVAPSAPQTTNQVGSVCAVEDTTVTFSGGDNYLATATGGNHRYSINGAPALTVADAGSITASPSDVVEVLWGNQSLTGYFNKVSTYTVPCLGTKTFSEKLARNGTLTIRIFNTNGDLIDGGTTNQSLTIGDVKTLKMELEGAYQKDFPYGFAMVIEMNKTTIDDVVISDRATGVELNTEDTPQSAVLSYGANSIKKTYTIPAVIGTSISEYSVTIDVDDANEPLGGLVTDDSDVKLTFFAKNYYVNDKVGGVIEGPSAEDEYNTVTRTGGTNATIHIA